MWFARDHLKSVNFLIIFSRIFSYLMKKVSSETWHEYLIKYLIFIVNDEIFWLMAHIHGMNKNIFRINFKLLRCSLRKGQWELSELNLQFISNFWDVPWEKNIEIYLNWIYNSFLTFEMFPKKSTMRVIWTGSTIHF